MPTEQKEKPEQVTTEATSSSSSVPSRLQPSEVDVVIYHSPCSDGTTSGLIAWKWLKANFPERNVLYKGMSPGSKPPEGLEGMMLALALCFGDA